MTLEAFLEEIARLSKPGRGFKPHKHVALLSVIRLIREGRLVSNHVPFSPEYREAFAELITRCGTEDDRNRPHTPFFHLSATGFWRLIPQAGKASQLSETKTIGSAGELTDLVSCAEMDPTVFAMLGREDVRARVEAATVAHIQAGLLSRSAAASDPAARETLLQRLGPMDVESHEGHCNDFVVYLNSLHNCQAGSEHALAEYQARSPFFSQIHVAHPLVDRIADVLLRDAREHVILTGHAGDGKTTIALDLCKQFGGISPDQPLSAGLAPREDFTSPAVSVVKDLSEWGQGEKQALLEEVLECRRRFLLVSNTGTLLDIFRKHAEAAGGSPVTTESELLEAISDASLAQPFDYAGVRFQVINLALLDNLGLARQIFARMLAQERWIACGGQACASQCPIRRNVELIQHHQDVVCTRLFTAYRRMYEYGTRLTLRQLTAHLAYMITSGLNYSDILKLAEGQDRPLYSEFMFFNRFFGDTGRDEDSSALQLPAVREVRRQGFGSRLCPTWERRLWWKTHGQDFRLGVPECDNEFDRLRSCGAGERNDASGLTPDQAREQVRRMLFFLYEFKPGETSFLAHHLGSPSLLTWLRWQELDSRLTVDERNVYMQRVYHVLQEHFTGVRLPEGLGAGDRRLYITLSRRRHEIRQSAQVVLAEIDWSTEMDLGLVRHPDVFGGERTDLELMGRRRADGAVLRLALPFLDYVIMRHFGEMGAVLQAAYVERLERFKAELLERTREDRADVMLVRLRMDNTFRRQQYSVRDGFLEVADV